MQVEIKGLYPALISKAVRIIMAYQLLTAVIFLHTPHPRGVKGGSVPPSSQRGVKKTS